MDARATPRSVGEIDSFVMLLRTACSDATVNARLERLLSLADEERQAVVHVWVTDLVVAHAPRDFIQAIACLADNAVAEKAHEVIYQCESKAVVARRQTLIGIGLIALVLVGAVAAWVL